MATFQFGRALLCALLSLSLTAASCGPGECEGGDAICKTDGGNTDAGPTDGGLGPNDPSVITLHAPTGVNQVGFYTVPFEQDPVLIPGCEAADTCSYTLPLGGIHEFTVRHHGYHMVSKKTESLRKFGHTYDLDWDGPGECGVVVGDPNLGEGHWPYKDENHPEWDKVYFRTEIYCTASSNDVCVKWQVILDDLGAIGVTTILYEPGWVIVTGLTFTGRRDDSGGSTEFSGTISSNLEEITYRRTGRDTAGNVTGESSGVFRRYHP